jgi:predicted DNA-binding protein
MPRANTQTSLRLPASLHDRLSDAAEAGGRGLGEEIRERLERSLVSEPRAADSKTRELLRAIERMADELADYYPPWHADPFSFRAFLTAVNKFLMWHYRPPGDLKNPEPKPKPGSPAADELFHEKATVDNVSAMLVAVANFDLDEERR